MKHILITMAGTTRYLIRNTLLGIRDDVARIVAHGRLVFGVLLAVVGVFSFRSGRYCDGNIADHFSCTRPATYYYYPEWAVVLIVFGSVLIVLWYLHSRE